MRRVDVDRFRPRRDRRCQFREVIAPAETLVKTARHRDATRRANVAHARRPLGIGNDHLIARFEQGLAHDVQTMDSAVGHHDLVWPANRNLIDRSELCHDQIQQPRYARRLQVVALVLVNGAMHRSLDGVRRVETDVALIEPERPIDGVHHVADADDS